MGQRGEVQEVGNSWLAAGIMAAYGMAVEASAMVVVVIVRVAIVVPGALDSSKKFRNLVAADPGVNNAIKVETVSTTWTLAIWASSKNLHPEIML